MQTRDASLALGKLRFWQDNIDSIFSGNLPNAEPISQSLRHECELHPISKIHFDRNIDKASYIGNVILEDFDIGTLIEQQDLGRITMNIDVDGKGFKQKYLKPISELLTHLLSY